MNQVPPNFLIDMNACNEMQACRMFNFYGYVSVCICVSRNFFNG